MILQHILFPLQSNSEEEELYFRRDEKSDFTPTGNVLSFGKWSTISFDTYFNAISVEKWLKYTIVNQIDLRLKIRGEFSLHLLHLSKPYGGTLWEETTDLTFWDTKGAIEEIIVPLKCSKQTELSAFKLTALSGDCEMYEGAYVTEVVPSKEVKLALIICTFLREQYILNNISILKETFLNNDKSIMRDKLKVYLSDNGNSLTVDETDSIKILPNKNTGGAGGFTRGMIEILQEQEGFGATHVLLMDDDVIIQPESIYRTYVLWSLIKPEHQNSFIGGAMLSQEKPWLQIEAGAFWNGGELKSRKAQVDLRLVTSCVQNEIEEKCDYNAWWYCSFSINHIREDNLPLPLFIRGDDIEFGLRNMEHLILMNGICIRHQSFEHKHSSPLYYYIYRNRLIVNAIHQLPLFAGTFWLDFDAKVTQELLVYRYNNVELMLAGVEDFLKGIKWLKQQDGEMLHRNILEKSYFLSSLEDLDGSFDLSEYKEKINTTESEMQKTWRKVLLNGMFLRSKGDAIVPVINPHAYYLYRKKRALHYDRVSEKGFVVARDRKKFLRLLVRLVHLEFKFTIGHRFIARKYRLYGRELMGLDFWEKYLELPVNVNDFERKEVNNGRKWDE